MTKQVKKDDETLPNKVLIKERLGPWVRLLLEKSLIRVDIWKGQNSKMVEPTICIHFTVCHLLLSQHEKPNGSYFHL